VGFIAPCVVERLEAPLGTWNGRERPGEKMRLTLHTDHALRVLIYVGLNDGKLTTIKDIAQIFGISKASLMAVAHGHEADYVRKPEAAEIDRRYSRRQP
jgi:hypothetical protein